MSAEKRTEGEIERATRAASATAGRPGREAESALVEIEGANRLQKNLRPGGGLARALHDGGRDARRSPGKDGATRYGAEARVRRGLHAVVRMRTGAVVRGVLSRGETEPGVAMSLRHQGPQGENDQKDARARTPAHVQRRSLRPLGCQAAGRRLHTEPASATLARRNASHGPEVRCVLAAGTRRSTQR
jgi:hypothetical protein